MLRQLSAAFVAVFTMSTAAVAAPTPGGGEDIPGLVAPGEVGSGTLLLQTNVEGRYLPAPTVATDARMVVRGDVVRATVVQQFANPGDGWVEGLYVFPLPDGAAVDRMRFQVGDRFVEGKVMERAAARQVYDDAKASGRKASLLEQERPNIFTVSVANIGPGEAVRVEIEYQEKARRDGGLYSLRFPMVVAPRYNPEPRPVASSDGGGLIDPVPDRGRITPPYARPEEGPANPVHITVSLDAGFPIGRLESPFHEVAIARPSDNAAEIALTETAAANRDFELVWSAGAGAAPEAALFVEKGEAADYFLLTVMPPDQVAESLPPRELVFILDVSGSMAGDSIRQAKAALKLAIDRLGSDDRFNLIVFSNDAFQLFPAARGVTAASRQAALRFIDRIEADGGTEMEDALRLALRDDDPGKGYLRQIVLLTDGAVGNEAELLRRIQGGLGQSRLFTVGIGSAPNSYFMRRAAETGRGSYTFIGSPDQVMERMSALFGKLERPALTDLRLDFGDGAGAVESYPATVPDLYYGEPVSVSIRLPEAKGILTLRGTAAGEAWERRIDLVTALPGAGMRPLWARARIAGIEDSLLDGNDPERVRQEILDVALTHRLLSRYTSLVVVDVTPSRPDDAGLDSRKIPAQLPDGWEWDKVFGAERAMPASPPSPVPGFSPADRALLKKAGPAGSAAVPQVAAMAAEIALPQGATDAEWRILSGLAGFILFAIFFLLRRRLPATGRPA